MAVAFDVFSSSTGTGTLSHTHTPVGTPRGIIAILVSVAGTDSANAATYGGVAMTEVALSPEVLTGGETGNVSVFFLGSSVPSGAQTAQITVNDAEAKAFGVISLTASNDTEVQDTSSLQSTSQGNPSVTLSLGGKDCFCALGAYSGIGNGSIAPLTNWTERLEHDFGNDEAYFATYNTIGSVDVTAGYTAGADDVALIAIAVTESTGGGGVTVKTLAALGVG